MPRMGVIQDVRISQSQRWFPVTNANILFEECFGELRVVQKCRRYMTIPIKW